MNHFTEFKLWYHFWCIFSPPLQRLHTGNSKSDGNYKVTVAFTECCFFSPLKKLDMWFISTVSEFTFFGGSFGQSGNGIIADIWRKRRGKKSIKTAIYRKTNAHVSVISAALIKLHWRSLGHCTQTELLTSALSHDREHKSPPPCGSKHAPNPKPVFSLAEPRTSLPSGGAYPWKLICISSII